MAPKPFPHPRIVKKRTALFKRFQFDRYKRVPSSWRRPIGIDSPMRRQYKGIGPRARIGYGSDKRTRHMLPNGFYKVTARNVRDLEPLTMLNRQYAVEIAGAVGWRGREKILEACRKKGIRVVNKYARTETADKQ